MRRLIAISLLIVPFCAQGQLVRVDYEGVVDYTEVSKYRVGDTIKGSLLIDMLLAPPDLFPNNPESGSYSRFLAPGQPDWLRGFNPRGAGNVHDRAFTRNQPGDDSYSIGDLRDLGKASFRALEVSVGGLEFMSSDALDQSLHVTKADNPGVFHGSINWGWDKTRRWVGFALKSFKVTPGRCMAS
jgi:hypothetical protein